MSSTSRRFVIALAAFVLAGDAYGALFGFGSRTAHDLIAWSFLWAFPIAIFGPGMAVAARRVLFARHAVLCAFVVADVVAAVQSASVGVSIAVGAASAAGVYVLRMLVLLYYTFRAAYAKAHARQTGSQTLKDGVRDYTASGFSASEAIADAQSKEAQRLESAGVPSEIARLLTRKFTLRIHCDGDNCEHTARADAQPDAHGRWGDTGWVHRSDLDFCPRCQRDGRMDAALHAHKRPLGATERAAAIS